MSWWFTSASLGGFAREGFARPGSAAGNVPVVRVGGERSVSKEALTADELPELPPGTKTQRADTATDVLSVLFKGDTATGRDKKS